MGPRACLPPSSPVFESYWSFAAARQAVYFARVNGAPPPWTNDPILAEYRFTNAYRAADRVSQFMLRSVIYDADHDEPDLVFRILLFKLFNRVETWQLLERDFGELTVRNFNRDCFAATLTAALRAGERIYSAAYIMPPAPSVGTARKHETHLALLESMLSDNLPKALAATCALREVYQLLVEYPGIGPFLAYQFAIDLNYSPLIDHSEMDFVQPGPGAIDGVRKCFPTARPQDVATIIHTVCAQQEQQFESRGIRFDTLWGRRLQLIDCQNLFCEISKYARVAHPEISGSTSRVRIKQRFAPAGALPPPLFPPKWGLPVASAPLGAVAPALVGGAQPAS